ncbi:MAG TPA: O-antigen ligase family protein [Solirubrobacteraceae bacterium]|nr:O-antigen ligase family protein [Solirubrobacteraceae bacterium]
MRTLLGDLAAALPALVGVGVLVAWSTDQGGYFARAWYPGTLLLLAVLAVAVATDPGSVRRLPRATRVAIGAFVLFTAWTFLSITWADAKGPAWDGANRTLLYLVVLALFSRSLASARGLAIALGAWSAAITVLAIVVLLKLPEMLRGGPPLVEPGLGQPFGYSNANAAIWLMALWPALALAACRDLPPWLRGLAAGAVVVLADTSLLSESRGSLVATAIVLVVLFAVVPGRVRMLLTLLAPAIAIGLTTPHLLQAANAAARDPDEISRLGEVAGPVLLAALVTALVVFAAATLLARRPPSPQRARTLHRAVAATGIVLALGGAAGAVAVAGNPADRARSAWEDFTHTGAPSNDSPGHLTAGFGGARYDYYQVAFDLFEANPITGIGIDNFAQDYLAHDRVGERPTSPHSLELRTLAQTGSVGALLLATAFAAAFLGAWRALRGPGELARAVAAGGALCCLYWIVHGSVDWLWEFPALGGAAFAALGLANAAAPRAAEAAVVPGRWARSRLPALAVLTLAAAATLAFPWTADIEVRRARASWPAFPAAAYRQLDLAAKLNPLSEQPGLATGTIAIRRREPERARRGFAQALERDPRNAFATMWLGAIASSQGRRAEAERLLARALALAPTDPVTQSAAAQARAGRIDLARLDREVRAFVGQLVD